MKLSSYLLETFRTYRIRTSDAAERYLSEVFLNRMMYYSHSKNEFC